MAIKGVKNKQFSIPLAGHKWPQKVVIFGNVKGAGGGPDMTDHENRFYGVF